MKRPATLASALLVLACTGGAVEVQFERYTLTLPTGWEVRRSPEEPNHSTLILLPSAKQVLCRLELIHGEQPLGPADVEAFLETAREDFEGSRGDPITLRTRAAVLRGFAVRQAVAAKGRRQGARGSASEIEVYAGTAGRDLIAVIAGGWGRDAEGKRLRAQCLAALKSLRIGRSDRR